MSAFKWFFIVLVLAVSFSCSNSEDEEKIYDIEGQTADGFEDGTYCADVTYYNPNTGTNSEYTLEVEVEGNQVVQIYWSNGGWLDEDHFYAETLDETGYCTFSSDKGYEYTVQITGRGCGSTDESSFQSDVEEDEQAVTCPKCGGEKSDLDSYCDDCTDEIENTCSRCGGFEYYVYGGLCSNCKSEEEYN